MNADIDRPIATEAFPARAPLPDPRSMPPAERGSLTIADRIVEKIAGHAVRMVPGASAAPRRILGLNVGQPRQEDNADVEAQVLGQTVTVRAHIAIRWPASVPATAQAVRERIRDELARITDLRVDHVDLEVTSLMLAMPEQRRVQ